MYQALYRKYRPKNFSDVVGQNIIVQTLKNSILNNSINHAYLFSGPRGTGKTSMDKIFANTINCENIKNGEKCNNCVFCTQNKNDDIIEIDAASNNGVDEIRELRNKVSLVPSIGKYKVYIIDEVHMLTVGAFNALLKTLEEPPAHAIFVLATTEPHKIPLTILSRCQRFDFKKIPENVIFDRLKYIAEQENINITNEAIMEIANTCDGGMRDAISMLDQSHSYNSDNIDVNIINEINGNIPEDEIQKLVNSIINRDLNISYEAIDKYIKEGKNLIKINEKLLLCFRNILLYKNAKEYFDKHAKCVVFDEGKAYITEGGTGFSGFGGVEFENIYITLNSIVADAVQTRVDGDGDLKGKMKSTFSLVKVENEWKIDEFADVDDFENWVEY